MEEFKKLKIPELMLRALEHDKFEKPTEIQEKAIPLVLEGRDIIAESATGSGKTLAFGSRIIQDCEEQGVIQALVLVPTRELADQVSMFLMHFAKFKPLEIVEIYGGVSMSPQIQKLKRADVVVGTPGRILDHLSHRTIELGYVKILVLDEADRMLDMGFIDDVQKIIKHCTAKKQTMLFSATISPEILSLAENFMINPISVSAEPQVDPKKLRQYFYDAGDFPKFSLLVKLLKEEHPGLVMVFCNTKRNTDAVAKNLIENNIDAIAIHGGLSQDKRRRVMLMFHSNKVCVLVCTDVAARGLDIKGVSHVYNYDTPNEPVQYIHRIGRTARAGKDGVAITLIANRDYENFSNIMKKYELDIERKELPEVPVIAFRYKSQSRFGGGNSGRGRFGGNQRRFSSGGSRGRFQRERSFSSDGRHFGTGTDRDNRDNQSRDVRGRNSRKYNPNRQRRNRSSRNYRDSRKKNYFSR